MSGPSLRESRAIAELLEARLEAYRRPRLAAEERLIKRLLGMWVSELPPTIVTGALGKVVGLSYGRELIIHVEDLP